MSLSLSCPVAKGRVIMSSKHFLRCFATEPDIKCFLSLQIWREVGAGQNFSLWICVKGVVTQSEHVFDCNYSFIFIYARMELPL